MKNNITLFCRKKKIKKTELSKCTGIPYDSLVRYARGERMCSVMDALSIANALETSVEELFGKKA